MAVKVHIFCRWRSQELNIYEIGIVPHFIVFLKGFYVDQRRKWKPKFSAICPVLNSFPKCSAKRFLALKCINWRNHERRISEKYQRG